MIPRLTLAHVRDIRDATGLDLLAVADESVWARVLSDAVWHAKVADMLTGESVVGDELANYIDQFTERLHEFYPKPTGSSTTPTNAPAVDVWQSVFQAAGAVGVEPWGYSLRELLWMADGAWRPFSALIAKLHNSNVQKKSDCITADSVNPYATSAPKKRRRRYPKAHLIDG